jgi:hypothetical protein
VIAAFVAAALSLGTPVAATEQAVVLDIDGVIGPAIAANTGTTTGRMALRWCSNRLALPKTSCE